jgi:SM-20-related protein
MGLLKTELTAEISTLVTTQQPQAAINQRIAAELAAEGWCVIADYIDPADCRKLYRETLGAYRRAAMQPAGIGAGLGHQVNRRVRGDFVKWLDPAAAGGAMGRYFDRLEGLRSDLNRLLYLGLFDFECHLAVYPPGAFYARHVDRHAGTDRRILSTVLYLNQAWRPAHGGELRLYLGSQGKAGHIDLAPCGGQLLLFLAGDFPHEVLTTHHTRASITGWYRTRHIEGLYDRADRSQVAANTA